jgi:hypothetical protein
MESGRFGAMIAASDGTMMLPLVDRDMSGNVTRVNGALWMGAEGIQIGVLLDDEGMPTRTVMGNLILLFDNWDRSAGTVDIAMLYGPSGYVEVFRKVQIPEMVSWQTSGVVMSAMTCFPACDTDLRNLSEMLKIGFTALSIGGCVAATVGTWGAMALPCAGALVSAVALVTPEDLWLEDVEQVGRILALTDAAQCTRGDVGGCVSFFGSVATEAMDLVDGTLASQAPTIAFAQETLAQPEGPAGLIEGSRPACANDYECTPGAYLPCYPEGTKQCGEDCRWGSCPKPEPEPSGKVTCSDSSPICECTVQSCVSYSMSGCNAAWYKTSKGNFNCDGCGSCNAAATAAIAACCPKPD